MENNIEKELKKKIKIFDKAYKDWNNKKLSEEKREKAQRIVDEMTDDYTDSHISGIKLKYYKLGKKNQRMNKMEKERNWLRNILVMDFSNMDKSEIKDLIKLRFERIKKRTGDLK